MKITQDVRDYADGLSDNEKKSLQLEADKGMAGMSDKFKELGGEIYLSESGEKREPID